MKTLDSTIIVGILSVIGTLVGSFGGIIAANKLTNYRIEQLEKKVDKHNTIIERTYIVERDMKTAFSYIEELKKRIAPDGRKRQYYGITDTGRAYLKELYEVFMQFTGGINTILHFGEKEESI